MVTVGDVTSARYTVTSAISSGFQKLGDLFHREPAQPQAQQVAPVQTPQSIQQQYPGPPQYSPAAGYGTTTTTPTGIYTFTQTGWVSSGGYSPSSAAQQQAQANVQAAAIGVGQTSVQAAPQFSPAAGIGTTLGQYTFTQSGWQPSVSVQSAAASAAQWYPGLSSHAPASAQDKFITEPHYAVPTSWAGLTNWKGIAEAAMIGTALAGTYYLGRGFLTPKPSVTTGFLTKSAQLSEDTFASTTTAVSEAGARTFRGIGISKTITSDIGISRSAGAIAIAEDVARPKIITGVTAAISRPIITNIETGASRDIFAGMAKFEGIRKPIATAGISESQRIISSGEFATYQKFGYSYSTGGIKTTFAGFEKITFPSQKTLTTFISEPKTITTARPITTDLTVPKLTEQFAVKQIATENVMGSVRAAPVILTGTAIKTRAMQKVYPMQMNREALREMTIPASTTRTRSLISEFIGTIPSTLSGTSSTLGLSSMQLRQTAAVTTSITTTSFVIPKITLPVTSSIPYFSFPQLGGGGYSGFPRRRKGRRRKYAYTPTLWALAFNIRGKKPKGIESGLRLRPITKGFSWGTALKEIGW